MSKRASKLTKTLTDLFAKLQTDLPEFSQRKYFYLNIWNLACKPCVEEIPYLDFMMSKYRHKFICLMLSSHTKKAVENFLEVKKIKINNFIFIDQSGGLISRIFSEITETNPGFPLHIILDKNGNALAYLFGSIHDDVSAAPLINFINDLE